ARRWSILANGARRNVKMHAVLFEHLGTNAEFFGVRPQIRLRRPRRLLHHVAELTGDSKSSSAGKQAGFDEQNLAAHFGPGHAGSDTRRQFLARFFGIELAAAEILLNRSFSDDDFLPLSL